MTIQECADRIKREAAVAGLTVAEYAEAINIIAQAIEKLPTDVSEWDGKFGALSYPPQLPPITNGSAFTWDLVITDMRERDRIGRAKYSTPLQPHNGRDSLQDAYEEALDLAVYLRNAIEDRKQ